MGVSQPFQHFLSEWLLLLLIVPGRATFRNLSRYSAYVDHRPHTFQNYRAFCKIPSSILVKRSFTWFSSLKNMFNPGFSNFLCQ
jgi:hypothetical protein